jgi:hypothetical protein
MRLTYQFTIAYSIYKDDTQWNQSRYLSSPMASNSSGEVELTSYSQQHATTASRDIEPLHDHANSDEGFSLPPTDGGKDAWLCLFACFMLEALIWGKLPSHS